MKKMYALVGAIMLTASIQAQNTITFESITLAPESYDNGQTAGGEFIFSGVSFSNNYTYDSTWNFEYFNGFAISNVTDNTTAGEAYGNYTGSGRNGSSNFTVCYTPGEINTGAADVGIDSFFVTNNTYAAISMRDGDFFGKQFGSPTNAQGNPDGTNGEDYFKLTVYGEDFSGTQLDSVDVYLADFRFANNAQDYILDTWVKVDLSGFSFVVTNVYFALESSDTGAAGMNTPAYFALDDLSTSSYANVPSASLLAATAFPNPMKDQLTVKGETGTLTIIDASGKLMYSAEHNLQSTIDVSNFTSGIYFVQLQNAQGSFTKKLVK